MEMESTEFWIGVALLFLALYYYLTYNFDFWTKLKVKGPKPLPVLGNFAQNLFGKIHFALLLKNYYDEYESEDMVGIFTAITTTPMLILRNPEFIKDVMIKDFNIFCDRGKFTHLNNDPVNQNLLTLEYKRWRPLRSILTSVFTSGKLKAMLYLIMDCAKHLEEYVDNLAKEARTVECRELSAKYTTDAIAICAFGLNVNSFRDEDSGFRKAGRNLMAVNLKNIMSSMLRNFFPRIYGFLRPLIYNRSVDYFLNSLNETMTYRKRTNTRRNDFVDLLMDLKDNSEKLNGFEFTDCLLSSQAFIFYLAGFETSSTTMSNALYELALHHDCQDKLRKEIQKVFQEDGQFTYENIKSMKYLDMVFKEVLRKYPPGSFLRRRSVAPYTFRGTNITIPEGTSVVIPVWAIHRDPAIYPKPEQFDPERFNDENSKLKHSMNFLPFGDGPHNCIGVRFAVYQTKIGLATLIAKFKIDVSNETITNYKIHPRALIPTPLGGLHLQITKL